MHLKLIQQLTPRLRSALAQIKTWDQVEEIRLRVNQVLVIKERTREYAIEKIIVSSEDISRSLDIMIDNSWYALTDEIRSGYLTLTGGHRVGICGKAILEQGEIKTFKYINGLNIRFAREVIGAASQIMPNLIKQGRIISTLIISPPGCGKTTLLRDISRQLSRLHYNVVVVDERSEIAACHRGIPQLDVGPWTYVIDGCPKAAGIMIALRGMAPDVIITDEIGHPNDGVALADVIRGGVQVISSCHGDSLEKVEKREWVSQGQAAFEQAIILSRRRGPGTIEQVLKWD